MSKNYPQVTSYLYDLMIILHKKIFNPLVISKAIHLTPAQFSVLFYLRRRDNSSVTDVAKYLKISKPNMTPILDALIKKGYLKRTRDEKDRRVIRLHLTASGKHFYENLKAANTHIVEDLFSDYSEEDLEQIMFHSSHLLNLIKNVSELMRDEDFNYEPGKEFELPEETFEDLPLTEEENSESDPNEEDDSEPNP